MARMIPDYVHYDCKSDAEKKLFQRFRDELPARYTVLHSLALSKHHKKIRSEIDFVIISRRGILCIEVKGGGVECQKGVWYFSDRYGEIHSKRESPFDQSSSNMYALKRSVTKKFGKYSSQSRSIFGYVVMMPDIEFEQKSPEWDLNRVIDRKGLIANIRTLIEQQFDYSEKEILRVTDGIKPFIMSESEKEILVKYLRGDFHFVPSLSYSIDTKYYDLIRLTEEQYDILDQLAENQRVVVRGMAGTGKTVLAVEKARRDARAGRHVLFVCFNRNLAQHIRSIISFEDHSEQIEIYTLHAYARKIIESAGLASSIESAEGDELFKKIYPELFSEAILKVMEEPPFDSLVVDEGQDLGYKPYLDMLDWVLKGGWTRGTWIWMEDNEQNLFVPTEQKCDADLSKFKPTVFRLTKNCRNTRPICLFTSLATGTKMQNSLVNDGPKVETFFFRDNKHQLRELNNTIKRLLSEGVKAEDIVMLTTVSPEKSVIKETNRIAGIQLIDYESRLKKKKGLMYSTIHSFKGLESKAIIVTDIENLILSNSKFLNYVGFSRAMSWLGVFISERIKPEFEQLAKEFGIRLSKAELDT